MNNFENNLDVLSNILQIKSYEILVKDFNNTDLMQYLKHQDEILDKIIKQNEKIIEQNEKILNMKKGEL
jgi:hypothetical protein